MNLQITIIVLIILAAVTIKTVTDMNIIQFAIKSTEDYSKAQDQEINEFGKIENLLVDTIRKIENGNTDEVPSRPEGPVNNPFTEADIGKYVNYVPQGIDYTVEIRYSGYSKQVFSQDTSLKWQIWKVENDTLYLISDVLPSTSGYSNTGNLYIKDVQGYNNGVTILDNICQANYGISGNANIKVQNLKAEDVLEVKADGIENIFAKRYGMQPYTYSNTFDFPSIWYNYERDNLEEAISNKSVAYPFIEETNSKASASSQKPYCTTWANGNMSTSDAWKSEEYYCMVINPAKTKIYWLSSRCVDPGNYSGCDFSLYCISANGIGADDLYHYNGGQPTVSGYNHGIRPLVQIPLKNCEIMQNPITENTYDIVIK